LPPEKEGRMLMGLLEVSVRVKVSGGSSTAVWAKAPAAQNRIPTKAIDFLFKTKNLRPLPPSAATLSDELRERSET